VRACGGPVPGGAGRAAEVRRHGDLIHPQASSGRALRTAEHQGAHRLWFAGQRNHHRLVGTEPAERAGRERIREALTKTGDHLGAAVPQHRPDVGVLARLGQTGYHRLIFDAVGGDPGDLAAAVGPQEGDREGQARAGTRQDIDRSLAGLERVFRHAWSTARRVAGRRRACAGEARDRWFRQRR
jgi:hypothetical protein